MSTISQINAATGNGKNNRKNFINKTVLFFLQLAGK